MAPPRRKASSATEASQPAESMPHKGPGNSLCAALVLVFLVVWIGIWLMQTLYEDPVRGESHPRWHLIFSLLFLPDGFFGGWIDGVVSLQGVFDRLSIVLIVCLVLVPGWLLGTQLLVRLGVSRKLKGFENVLLGLAIGLSLHATATLLAGLAGIVSSAITMPCLAILEIAVWLMLGGYRAARSICMRTIALRVGVAIRMHRLPVLLTTVAVFLIGSRSMIPAQEFDVLEYHLGAAKEWYQAGGIGFMPHNIYANMPMAAEMQSLSAMAWAGTLHMEDDWWWGGIAGKWIMFIYWMLAVGLAGCIVRRLAGREAAYWLVAVAASGTAFAEVTVLGLIEAAVACYFAAGLLILVLMQRHRISDSNAWLGGGFFAGSAFACKYPALLFVCVPLGLILLWLQIRSASQKAIVIRGIALFLAGCLLTAGPWLAKNTVLAHNPVYPLAAGYLGGYKFSESKMQRWQNAHAVPTRKLSALGESLKKIAWTWRSQDALLIPLMLLGLLMLRRSQWAIVAAAIALCTLAAWWLLTHHLERFLLPSIPAAMILAGFGIRLIQQRLGRRATAILLTSGISCNFVMLAASPTMGDPRILVDTSYLRREAIASLPTNRVPEHVLWVNTQLSSADTRLLLVGDAAIYNYEVPLVYATCFDQNVLSEIASQSSANWHAQLQQLGISHVLIHWGEIRRYRSPGNYGFDANITGELIQKMVDQQVLVPLETQLDPNVVQVFAVSKEN